MKKAVIFFVICLLIAGTIFLLLNKGASGKKSPEYLFTYAENHPVDYPTALGAFRFAELVEQETNGRIQIMVKAGGVLGEETEIIEQLQLGGIDFSRISLSPLAEVIPRLNVLQMPYLYKSAEHMWDVLEGEIGQELADHVADFDVIALSWYDAGARNFYNTKYPITRLEDMKGLNMRVQMSSLMVAVVEALGANAIPIAYGDVYSSLETGRVDGAENNWPSYESTHHYEIARYYSIDEHTRVPELQLCSEATWKKLSDDDKNIIRRCAQASAEYERILWTEREKHSEELVKQSGVTVVSISEEEKLRFQQAVSEVYVEYCSDEMDLINRILELGNSKDYLSIIPPY